ncbi:hypothetical protein JXM67_15090 [candidate division WOR-3 bacterium]|nr:hypothetical protein [candidate division WOR-3 bacterium]
MHLAPAGFFDYMMKGLPPGPEVYGKMENVDLKTIFEQFLTKHWYSPGGPEQTLEADLKEYIEKWGDRLESDFGWENKEEALNIRQWYPFFVSEEQTSIPRYDK